MYLVKTIAVTRKQERSYCYAQEKAALAAMARLKGKADVDGVFVFDINHGTVTTDTGAVFKIMQEVAL